jgi:hypothetical protein
MTESAPHSNIPPRVLDWAINGIPVYIRERHALRPTDRDLVYATTHDFSRFTREEPLETMRIKVPKDAPPDWDPTTAPKVIERVHFHNSKG